MSQNDGIPAVELRCDQCGVVVLTAKARIAPSIIHDGWLCGDQACASKRDSTPVAQTGVEEVITDCSLDALSFLKGGRGADIT